MRAALVDLTGDAPAVTEPSRADCSICLEAVDHPFAAHCCRKCGNLHHARCQFAWLEQRRRAGKPPAACPLCRAQIAPQEVRAALRRERRQRQLDSRLAGLREAAAVAHC
jgi:hypothetical protein